MLQSRLQNGDTRARVLEKRSFVFSVVAHVYGVFVAEAERHCHVKGQLRTEDGHGRPTN